MTQHEAARLIVSRNPQDYNDKTTGICMGIDCKDCFDCIFSFTLENTSADIKKQAQDWLDTHPEPILTSGNEAL